MLAHKFFFRGGGTATYLFNLMDSLQERGHRAVPFSIAYDRADPSPYSKYFVSPPAGSNEAFYAEIRKSPRVMLKLLGRATFSTEAYRKAKELIEAEAIDLAYVHNVYNYMSPSVIPAAKSMGIPVVMRVSDYNLVCAAYSLYRGGDRACTECLDQGWTRALAHRCVKGSLPATVARVFSMRVHSLLGIYRKVDLFVTPSGFMRRTLIRAGFPGEKIVHIPSFVPLNGAPQGGLGGGEYILYFGRVSREKGLDALIRAHKRLSSPPPLLIVGGDRDGERARLEQVAASEGDDRVRFEGHQPPDELQRLIAGSVFTVVPSLQHDNCPMSVLESFAQGKPVVGSNMGGIPEQLADGCGLLFEAGDVDGLVGQMQALLDDPGLRAGMGARAYQRLKTDFDKDRHCDRLLGLFESLCNGAGNHASRGAAA